MWEGEREVGEYGRRLERREGGEMGGKTEGDEEQKRGGGRKDGREEEREQGAGRGITQMRKINEKEERRGEEGMAKRRKK